MKYPTPELTDAVRPYFWTPELLDVIGPGIDDDSDSGKGRVLWPRCGGALLMHSANPRRPPRPFHAKHGTSELWDATPARPKVPNIPAIEGSFKTRNAQTEGGMDVRTHRVSRGSPSAEGDSTRPGEGAMNRCFPSRGSRVRIPFPAPDQRNQGSQRFWPARKP